MRRHILLVGLPGCGKSSVGRVLASHLGTECSDVDALIENEVGLDVATIFATRGEKTFRDLEQQIVACLLKRAPHVIAPGGGWITLAPHPGVLADRALLVYLRVAPHVAVERLAGAAERPLVSPDPQARLDRLLAEREPSYRLAEAAVDTDGKNETEVASEILGLARILAGW